MNKYILFFLIGFVSFSAHARTEFCVVGDMGTGSDAQYAVADSMLRAGCLDIMVVGDMIYPAGAFSVDDPQWVRKFEKPYAPLFKSGAQFFFSLGNHDYLADWITDMMVTYKGYAETNPYVYFPNRYYNFALGDICFWALDTVEFDENQAHRLAESMAYSSDCSWRIAFGHHPIMSSGEHGNAKEHLLVNLHPILDAYADVYFAGHDHNLSDEGWVSTEGHGYRQIVSGAGAKLRDVQSCEVTGCLFSAASLGFVKVYVEQNVMQMDFIDDKGQVLYSTVIEKK